MKMASDSIGVGTKAEVRGGGAMRSGRRRWQEAARPSKLTTSEPQTEKQAGADQEGEEAAPRGRGHRPGDARRGRGAESEEEARWTVNQLDKEKLELTSKHNRQLCLLEAEVARLRSAVERGEAQRAELQYQLTVTHRDAEQAAQLHKDKHTLTERAAQLQHSIQELQKVVDMTQQAREKDQRALQQEVEERDRLLQSCNADNQQLRHLLQEQEEALEAAGQRLTEARAETERQAQLHTQLTDREETARRERQACEQRLEAMEAGLEAERAAHRQSKFSAEVVQLRARDLEAALAVERRGQREAQRELGLLRARLQEHRERGAGDRRELERLQQTTSDLTRELQEERKQHAHTSTLLEQATLRHSHCEHNFSNFVSQLTHTLQQLNNAGCDLPAKDDGNLSPSAGALLLLKTTISSFQTRQQELDKQVQELLMASELLLAEKQTVTELSWDQKRRLQESQQEAAKLQQEMQALKEQLHSEGGELQTLREEQKTKGEELQTLREELHTMKQELQRQRDESSTEAQKAADHYRKRSEAHLSFLHSVYQRLLVGGALLDQPQSIVGNFSWEELCDVIDQQVEQLTSDLHKANGTVAHLHTLCEKKSACVQQLQRTHHTMLSHLEHTAKRREEEWSARYTQAVTRLQRQLQLCGSECEALRERLASAASELSRLQRLLAARRGQAASLLCACALLAGAVAHARRRLHALCQQKRLLGRQLAAREQLELQVRRLATALGGEEEKEAAAPPAGRRRWRRSALAVMAAGRWRALATRGAVLFRLERGDGGAAVCVSGDVGAAAQKATAEPGVSLASAGGGRLGEDADAACVRWLRSKRLAASVLAATADLRGALARHGNRRRLYDPLPLAEPCHANLCPAASAASSPADVMAAARSGLSLLLDEVDPPEQAFPSTGADRSAPPATASGDAPQGPVSRLQRHFLLFSQRLHAAEVERRSLRVELANQKRAEQLKTDRSPRTVPVQRFHSVCVELRHALSREQEAQLLVQNQSVQLEALQLQLHTHTAQRDVQQRTLRQAAQSVSAARRQATQRDRSLRILGKHLSGLQREKKQLEERLHQSEEELRDAGRRRESLVGSMKAAEHSYKEVREAVLQWRSSPWAEPRSLPLPEHPEPDATESARGAPEALACQSLLLSVSQLLLACSGRIDWLQQEVSAHRSHASALRGELQDACLRDDLARHLVFPHFPFDEVKAPALGHVLKRPAEAASPAPRTELPKRGGIIPRVREATHSQAAPAEVGSKE